METQQLSEVTNHACDHSAEGILAETVSKTKTAIIYRGGRDKNCICLSAVQRQLYNGMSRYVCSRGCVLVPLGPKVAELTRARFACAALINQRNVCCDVRNERRGPVDIVELMY